MRRRAFLAAMGTSVTMSTTGCLTSLEDRLDTSIQLGWFGGHNFDTESHQFEFRVKRDGTRVHHSSQTILPREGSFIHGAVAECTWGEVAGDYIVEARVDGNEWVEESVTKVNSASDQEIDCATAEARYQDGSLTISCQRGCNPRYDGMCPFTK